MVGSLKRLWNWQNFSKMTKKKEKRYRLPKLGMKRKHPELYKNLKDYEEILWTTLCQQFDNLAEMGKFIDRNYQIDLRRNIKSE